MLVKRSSLAKIPTPELQAQYKKACAEFKVLNDRCAVMRAELVARQNIADAEAKLAKAKAEHAAGMASAEKEAK